MKWVALFSFVCFQLTAAQILNSLTVFKLTTAQDPEQFIFLNKDRQEVIFPGNYVRFFNVSPMLKWDERSKLIKTLAKQKST